MSVTTEVREVVLPGAVGTCGGEEADETVVSASTHSVCASRSP